jgi:hypothetical protein
VHVLRAGDSHRGTALRTPFHSALRYPGSKKVVGDEGEEGGAEGLDQPEPGIVGDRYQSSDGTRNRIGGREGAL